MDRWNSWRFTETFWWLHCKLAICPHQVWVRAERQDASRRRRDCADTQVYLWRRCLGERVYVCVCVFESFPLVVNQQLRELAAVSGRPFHAAWQRLRHTSRSGCRTLCGAITYSQSRDYSRPPRRFIFQSYQTWKTSLQKHLKMDEARQAVSQERLRTSQTY